MSLRDLLDNRIRVVLSLILVVAVYLAMNFLVLRGMLAYVVPSALWMASFLMILHLMGGLEQLSLWTHRPVVLIAFLTAAMQIVCLYFIALFTELGRSPYSFTPMGVAINIAYFTAPILAQETARAYAIRCAPKSKKYAWLVLVTLLFTLLRLSTSSLIAQRSSADTIKFVTSEVIPAGAQSLLATYLALMGGPLASIAYMWTLEASKWLIPILPNPPWGLKALISTLIPAIGLVIISESMPVMKMMAVGVMRREEVRRVKTKSVRAQKSKELLSIVVGLVLMITIWSTTGMLGCQVTVVASGSMRPTMDVGDVIVAVQMPVEKIVEGDIVQYWRSGLDAPITHRVVEVKSSGGTFILVTKGDANSVLDEPVVVMPKQKLFKVMFVMPKVGWASIALKSALSSTMMYLIENPPITYILLAIAINALVIYVLTHVVGLRRIRSRGVSWR
ncbi:MAG: signal peptidase I [Candidatus Nezhaarchaeales archaeon]